MTRPEQDALTVAAGEVIEAGASAIFYHGRLLDYVEHGDATGARRSALMAEQAAIRVRVAIRVYVELCEGAPS